VSIYNSIYKLSMLSMFDFYSFHNNGGFQFNYDSQLHINLAKYIFTKEVFKLAINDNIPVYDAVWDKEFHEIENAPNIYIKFLKELLNHSILAKYQEVHGRFTFKKLMLHKTPIGYINKFHAHTYDETDLHILCHFSKEERDIHDGGVIQIGKVIDYQNVKFDSTKYYQSPPLKHLITISSICNTGLITVINNKNPYFRHQVTEVLSNKDRITLMVALGYGSRSKIKNKVINYI
jgi:hypothetical protein